MLSFNNMSTEELYSLHYQKPPNLATELTKIFEKVIQFKKDNEDDLSGSRLIKCVTEYFVKEQAPKMLEVIKKYTGLNLNLMVASRPYANFAISFDFGEFNKGSNANFPTKDGIVARYTGKISNDLYEKWEKEYNSVKSQEELIKLSKTILNDKSAIKAGMFEKYGLQGSIYFCPYLAFFPNELFNGDRFEAFSAEELSSIICHECGHVIAFIVHASDLCYKKDILYSGARKAIRNFDQKEKTKVVLKLIEDLFPDKSKEFSQRISKLQDDKKKENNSLLKDALITLLINTITEFFYIIIKTLKGVFFDPFTGLSTHKDSYDKYGKFSDFSNALKAGNYYDEELADEYVSKMGYSHHLTIALHKLETYARFLGTEGYHGVNKICYYYRLLPWMAKTIFEGYSDDSVHPDEYKREENLMMDVIKAFKSEHLDPRLIDDYYKSFKFIKEIHNKKSVEKSWEKVNRAFSDFIEYITSTPYEMLYESRFTQEYNRLFNQVKSLMHNNLYALSYGLKKKAGSK